MRTRTVTMSAAGVGADGRGRGFTLIELLVVLGIIALLSSILLIAVRSAVNTSRVAGERQVCTALKMACSQFKQQFGFLPPVINEDHMAAVPSAQFNTAGVGIEQNQPVLRNILADSRTATPMPDNWYSVNSLAIYLVGAADAKVDGVEGPGFTEPKDNGDKEEGHFLRKGRTYEPLFDVAKDPKRLRIDMGSYLILDRWQAPGSDKPGNRIRYYRWEPTYFERQGPNAAPDPSLVGQVKFTIVAGSRVYQYNVPGVVLNSLRGTATTKTVEDFPELRGGGFAIVSAGPDGKFSDDPTRETPPRPVDPTLDIDNIVEIGK